MSRPRLRSIPFKSLPSPILRLTPVICEYVRLRGLRNIEVGPDTVRHGISHLRALEDYLRTISEASHMAPGTMAPLMRQCHALKMLRGLELVRAFAELVQGMQAIYAAHQVAIRAAITADPGIFRKLYMATVDPKHTLGIFADDTWAESEKLEIKLTDRCWYGHCRSRQSEGLVCLRGVDIALFVPGQQPIRPKIEEAVVAAGIPILVLVGAGQQKHRREMATLRTEFWYRRSGHHLLYAPFAPARLYQAIDQLHLNHLARRRAMNLRMAALPS